MNIYNLFCSYDIIQSLYMNRGNREDIKKYLDKLKEYSIEEELKSIIIGFEEASLIEDNEEYNHKLYIQYLNMNVLMTNMIPNILEQLQQEINKTNINDFYIIEGNSCKVTIAGSFDRGYYHELEIIFSEVEFICCPTNSIQFDRIRLASKEEVIHFGKILNGYEKQGQVICLENSDSEEKYFIVAQVVTYKWGNVYYYNRENLQQGEKIADWVINKV